MNITWLPSVSASSMYAVCQLLKRRPLLSDDLAAALTKPASILQTAITSSGGDPQRFFEVLVPQSAKIDSNLELARVTLLKAVGHEQAQSHASRIADAISGVKAAFDRQQPQLVSELALREQPLRMQWEAQGAGLMYSLTRVTEPDFVPSSARIVLVAPVLGGGGWAHPHFNQVSFEAVLTNVVPELPEVLRLAWLLAHMELDLPRYTEDLAPGQRQQVGSLALVPMTLFAAERLEMLPCNPTTIATAIRAWLPDCESVEQRAQTVYQWWQVYLDRPPSVAAGLLALAHMLEE